MMTPAKVAHKIFPIATFISDLRTDLGPELLPPSPEHDPPIKRLVIVGDVHGMRKSLEALLHKVGFNKEKGDHLILVGDLINKGPDSPGVVDLAIKLGASAVRGNHDNAVLDAAAEIRDARNTPSQCGGLTSTRTIPQSLEANLPSHIVQEPGVHRTDVFPATNIGTKHSAATLSTASALSTQHLDWLATLPLILRVSLPGHLISSLGHTVIVVHAGLVPNIPLEEQNPHTIMHMRSLIRAPEHSDRFTAAETAEGQSWAVEWDRWQEQQASKVTVIFGHDAKRRLQLGRHTIGLDSGCLYGNQLSAVVIAAPDGEIEHRIVQVECVDVPVPPTDR